MWLREPRFGKPKGTKREQSPFLPPGSWVSSWRLVSSPPHVVLCPFYERENISPDQAWLHHPARGTPADSAALCRARQRHSRRTDNRHLFICLPGFPTHTWPNLKGLEPWLTVLFALDKTNPTAGWAWQRAVPCFMAQTKPGLNPTFPNAQIWPSPHYEPDTER